MSIVVFLCLVNARHATAKIMEVLEGSRKESSKYLRVEGGQGCIPVYGTGEAAEGGFGGEVWVLTIRNSCLIPLPIPDKSY